SATSASATRKSFAEHLDAAMRSGEGLRTVREDGAFLPRSLDRLGAGEARGCLAEPLPGFPELSRPGRGGRLPEQLAGARHVLAEGAGKRIGAGGHLEARHERTGDSADAFDRSAGNARAVAARLGAIARVPVVAAGVGGAGDRRDRGSDAPAGLALIIAGA